MSGKLLRKEEEKTIISAIQEVERLTTAEVRVHVDAYCKGSPVLKAENLFVHLKMHKTEQRNGVLIYVALQDHKFAVIGDKGIHNKAGEEFWKEVVGEMTAYFQSGEIVAGICEGVNQVGKSLVKYYPGNEEDQNELRDDISYS